MLSRIAAGMTARKIERDASFFLPLPLPPFSDYVTDMSGFFFIAMIIAMLLTVAVLGMGLFSMVKGGEFNQKYGNRLMRARVIMQGVALALFALAILSADK
jgi:hypothetical protein